MKKNMNLMTSVVSGLLAGVLFLGIMGRIATSLLSLSLGAEIHFSMSGLIQTLLIAGIFGVIGGIFNYIIDRIFNLSKLFRCVVLSVLLFLVSLFFSVSLSHMDLDFSKHQLITLSVVFIVYLIFGYVTNIIVDRCKYVGNFEKS